MRNTRDTRGPDERRVAHTLRRNGVGPDALDTRNETALTQLWDDLDAAEHPERQQRITEWWRTDRPSLSPVDEGEELEPILTSGRGSQPVMQPEPAATEATDPEQPDDEQATPGRFAPVPGYWWRPNWGAARQQVQRVALSPKTRQFLYTASAAATGYGIGLEPKFAAWLDDCSTHAGIPAALIIGIGGCLVLAELWDRRTRHWWIGLAWFARIPLASAALALALYAPGTV